MIRKQVRMHIRHQGLVDVMRRVIYPAHVRSQLVEKAPSAYRDIVQVIEEAELVQRRIRPEPVAILQGWRRTRTRPLTPNELAWY